MINEKMVKSLNKQINAELYAAYLYMAVSSHASFAGLPGTANWFFVQAQEEMTHAQRIYNYVNSVGEHVILETIEKPPSEWKSITDMFSAALEHEKKVTAMINAIADQAVTEKDHATEIFIQWFITEQIEEEQNVNDILAKLKLAGGAGDGLFMIDKDLGARVFTPPADLAGA